MRLITTLSVLAMTGLPAMAQVDADSSSPPAVTEPATGVEAVEALVAEYDAAMQAFFDGYMELSTDEERAAYAEEHAPDPAPFAERAWDLAAAEPGSEAALKAVIWAMNVSRNTESVNRGIAILDAHFLESESLAEIVDTIGGMPSREADAFLRKVLAKTPHRSVKAMTIYALSSELGARISLKSTLEAASEEELDMYRSWLSSEGLAFIQAGDVTKLTAERGQFLKQLVSDYGDVQKYGRTLSELAAGDIYELEHLQVGMPAPEIEDVNLDGEPMKLSDFRGKVVMLDFWGDW